MGLFFAAGIGLLAGLLVLVIGAIAVDVFEQFRSPFARRFWIGWIAAFCAGITALELCVVVGFLAGEPSPGSLLTALEDFPFVAFLGAPYVYVTTLAVIVTVDGCVRRGEPVSAFIPISVGVGLGAAFGLIVDVHWASSLAAFMLIPAVGVSMGTVVGWAFWYTACRGEIRVLSAVTSDQVDDRRGEMLREELRRDAATKRAQRS
jgi:hypothetical protein